MSKLTRTKETEQEYTNRAKKLCIRAYNEAVDAGVDVSKATRVVTVSGNEFNSLNVVSTAQWAAAKWVELYAPSTWRKYRSSLQYYANNLFNNGNITSKKTLEKIEIYLSNKSKINCREKKRTSALKKKNITVEDYKKLALTLGESRSKNSKMLILWLYVNTLVGLRPSEWKNTKILHRDGKESIQVTNAKNTNGRSHGEYRYISIEDFSEKDKKMIKNFQAACQAITNAGGFDKVYSDCRKLLQRTVRRIWPKRKKNITLYTTRHQFSADLKKSNSSLSEIAYLMGHISTETATSHYGKRRYGNSKIVPKVNPKDLVNIKHKVNKFSFSKNKNKNKPKM